MSLLKNNNLKTTLFVKAFTCYRLTTVAVILVNREFSLLNVFFRCYYRELNGYVGTTLSITESIFYKRV